MPSLRNVFGILAPAAGLLVASCAMPVSQPSTAGTAPSIVQTWIWTDPVRNCNEAYTFRTDGTESVLSGAQRLERTYTLSRTPEPSGRYKLTTTEVKDSQGTGCGGPGQYDPGEVRVKYVEFLPQGQMQICAHASGGRCIGPLRDPRAPPPVSEFGYAVLKDEETRVGFWGWVEPDCSMRQFKVRIVTPPRHGQLLVTPGVDTQSRWMRMSDRCKDVKPAGTFISYRSDPDFSGDDEATVEAIYPSGYIGRARYTVSVFDRIATPVSKSRVNYPSLARSRDIEGAVVAWVHIDPHGDVTRVEIRESPDPILSDEVVSDLARWKFAPAVKAGKPASMVGEYTIKFKLTGPLGDVETRNDAAPGPDEIGGGFGIVTGSVARVTSTRDRP